MFSLGGIFVVNVRGRIADVHVRYEITNRFNRKTRVYIFDGYEKGNFSNEIKNFFFFLYVSQYFIYVSRF